MYQRDYVFIVLFVVIFFLFFPIHPHNVLLLSSSSSFSVPLQLPGHALAFSSMYIFRSRVIKLAPAGMCWNRMSLILPCPHRATKTQICIHIFDRACTNKCSILCFPAVFASTYGEKPVMLWTCWSSSFLNDKCKVATVHHLPATFSMIHTKG